MDKEMARIRLRLLGGLDIFDSTNQSIQLSVKKAKALLVYLGVQPHIGFSRDQLAEFFWPNSTNVRARQSLRQAIADLRKHIPDFDNVIRVSQNNLQANEANLNVDLISFRQLANLPDPRAHDEAYCYYRGHFLEGFCILSEPFSAWCEAINQSVHQQSIAIIESLSEHQLLEGNPKGAIEFSQRLIQIDPVRESAHRNLMNLYAKLGDFDAAIEQYTDCCRKLKQLLDTEPEPQTKLLYARIQKHISTAAEDVIQADSTAQNEIEKSTYPRPECIGRENEMNMICSSLEHTLTTKQGQSIFLSGDDGIGKHYFLNKASKFARQLGMTIASTRFFDINKSHENGIKDLLLNVINIPISADNDEIPIFITNKFFNNHPKYEVYLAALYSIFGFQIPRRSLSQYSALNSTTRELLTKTVVVEIISNIARTSPLLLIFEDSQHITAGMLQIISALIKLTRDFPITAVYVSNQQQDKTLVETKDISVSSIKMTALSETQTQLLFPTIQQPKCIDLLYLSWLQKFPQLRQDELPESLAMILKQLKLTLNIEDRQALDIATILGLRFSSEVLSSLLDNPHYLPDQLIQQGYVKKSGTMLEFSHQKTQQILYSLLEDKRRSELHFKAASYYLFANPHMHAYHLDAAGSKNAAKAYLCAALSASDEFKPELAVHFYDKALASADDNHEKYFAAIHKGDLLLESDRIALAVQAYDYAQNFAANQQEQTLAWLGMAIGLIERQQYSAARSLLERCEPVLTKNPDHAIQAKLYYYLSKTMNNLKFTDTAVRYIKIAFEHAKQAKTSYWQAKIALALGEIEYRQLKLSKAFSDFSLALQLSQENKHADIEILVLIALAKVKLFKADFQGAAVDLDHAMNIASANEDHQNVLEVLCVLCLLDFYKGQFARLQQHTELAADLCKLIGISDKDNHIASYQLLAAYHTNNLARQQQLIKDIQNNIDPANITSSYVLAPIMALTETNADDARAYLANSNKTLSRLSGPESLECYFLSIEAAIRHQLWDTAITIADNLIVLINNEPLPFFIMCAERVRILSQIAQDNMTEITRTELVDIFASAKHFGLEIHLPAYETALNQLRDPIQL